MSYYPKINGRDTQKVKSFRRQGKRHSNAGFWSLKILPLSFGVKNCFLPFLLKLRSSAGLFQNTEQYLDILKHPGVPEVDLRCESQDPERGNDMAKVTFGFTAEPGLEPVPRMRELLPSSICLFQECDYTWNPFSITEGNIASLSHRQGEGLER